MAVPQAPPLHIFPPLEQVEKRREELDAMIQKSMAPRRARPTPRDRYGSVNKRNGSRSRTRAPSSRSGSVTRGERQSLDRARDAANEMDCREDHADTSPTDKATPVQYSAPSFPESRPQHAIQPQIQPPMQPMIQLPEFNPHVMKTAPLPAPPTHSSPPRKMRSSVRVQPQRSMSTRGRGRGSGSSPSTNISPSESISSSVFSNHMSSYDSPITEPSICGEQPQYHRFEGISSRPQHPEDSTPIRGHPPRTSSRDPYRSRSSSTEMLLARDHSVRDNRQAYGAHQEAGQPSPVPEFDESPSSTLRTNELFSPEDFYSTERERPSVFPSYENSIRSSRPDYSVKKSSISSSQSWGSTPVMSQDPSPRHSQITPSKALESLWDVSNGHITAQIDGPINLKMFRPTAPSKNSKIAFGPSEDKPFYSLSQAAPPIEAMEDEPHEILIFRHHQVEDELLPISHSQLHPPPAPTMSKSNRSAGQSKLPEPANHITTITPILATLHALDYASKTPQAHTLALVDPKAESPAAARMAERAVKAATERESCALTWTRRCPRTGAYELHHPSLGVFAVAVDGDVKGALSPRTPFGAARRVQSPQQGHPVPASISIINPFASLVKMASPDLYPAPSPSAFVFGAGTPGLARGSGLGLPRPPPTPLPPSSKEVLATLDLAAGVLHLDAPAIQSLGSIYLLDVAVSTLLAVAVAEAARPDDPGLVFAAPPPSLVLARTRKATRIFSSGGGGGKASSTSTGARESTTSVGLVIMPKRGRLGKDGGSGKKVVEWTTTSSAIIGIEHLATAEDLPRMTRGILRILGTGFKTAVWLLEFGLRISARMVIALSRLSDKI